MTQVWNLWGGLMYLVAPPKTHMEGVEVIVQMAVPAPYYKSGESDVGQTGMCLYLCVPIIVNGRCIVIFVCCSRDKCSLKGDSVQHTTRIFCLYPGRSGFISSNITGQYM